MKRIVVKVGTNLITDEQGRLDPKIMRSLVDQIVSVRNEGIDVILVTSGSMGAGRSLLKLPPKVNDVVQRQVLSSLGQVKLIEAYSKLLDEHGKLCCQILVCKQDFRDRHHYLNMKNCFESLLTHKILPIVNENDAIAIDELMFTDNDELAGLIASMLDCDALMILTNVDGVYDRHPADPEAKVIPEFKGSTDAIGYHISDVRSQFGRGGMHTKCRVASHLAALGIQTHIANGTAENVIVRLVNNDSIGTRFVPEKRLSGIKKWISTAEGQEKGAVWINEGAEKRLAERNKACSLLPVGVTKVEGSFGKGDLIKIKNGSGASIGIGIACCDSTQAEKEMGQKEKRPLIHYDYLYLKEEA